MRHIEHGNRLKELLPEAVEIYGNTFNRVRLFEDFKEGKTTVVISTLCGEGFDMPSLSAVIIAHDTQDSQQIIGRTVRLHPGKEKSIVVHPYDHHYVFKNHRRYNEKVFYNPQNIDRKIITRSNLYEL